MRSPTASPALLLASKATKAAFPDRPLPAIGQLGIRLGTSSKSDTAQRRGRNGATGYRRRHEPLHLLPLSPACQLRSRLTFMSLRKATDHLESDLWSQTSPRRADVTERPSHRYPEAPNCGDPFKISFEPRYRGAASR